MSEEKQVRVGVAVIVQNREGRILFGLRKGAHGGGTWSLPGGHVDFGEEPETTARREVFEETGLEVGEVKPYAPCPYVNSHFKETGKQYITLYFTAEYLSGEPMVTEPEKCERWVWTDPQKLPSPLFEPIEKNTLHLSFGGTMREKTTLDVLKLSVRTWNALEGANIKTLSALTALTTNDLRKKKNIGRATLLEIAEALHRHGLYLKDQKPDAPLGAGASYTVVVALSAEDAQVPRVPTQAFVLPSGRLSLTTIDSFRQAAAEGGCQVRVFTVGDSGVEHVKHELRSFSATRLM